MSRPTTACWPSMRPRLPPATAVMLAQFSTARALAAVERAIGIPVLTAPDAAVAKLRRILAA